MRADPKTITKEQEAMTMDEIVDFLKKHGITTATPPEMPGQFNRTLHFQLHDQKYTIIWFKNESTLLLGWDNGSRCARIPFKWLFHDTAYPLQHGNSSIAFSYQKLEKINIFDREFPYEVFRIPL